jgi:hypothetical protein
VEPQRVDRLERSGHPGVEEIEEIRLDGIVAPHLASRARNQGCKGFNKPGIDGVLRALDPRAGVRETAVLQAR